MPPNRTTTTIWTKVQNLEAAVQQNLTILAATHCMYTENRNLLYFTLISNSRLTENIWTHYFSFFILTNKLLFGQRTRRGWWPKHSHIYREFSPSPSPTSPLPKPSLKTQISVVLPKSQPWDPNSASRPKSQPQGPISASRPKSQPQVQNPNLEYAHQGSSALTFILISLCCIWWG